MPGAARRGIRGTVNPRNIPGESDSQTELASGLISREDAIQIAYAAMSMEREKDDPRYLRAFLMDGKWLISNSYALGGGWIVTINGCSGEVDEKRRLPAR